jgi:Ca2+/H+ antiporter
MRLCTVIVVWVAALVVGASRPSVVAMVVAIVVMTVVGSRRGAFDRRDGVLLLVLYPAFLALAVLTSR